MSTGPFEAKLSKLLMLLERFPHLGNTTVLPHDDCGFEEDHDLTATDIVVYYDYVTDDCDKTERDKFGDWLTDLLSGTTKFMEYSGYKLIDENDGSGNGMHYGILQFRKA